MIVVTVARKPMSESSVVTNVLKHGTGAINVDACRIERPKGDGVWGTNNETVDPGRRFNHSPEMREYRSQQHPAGRWPANLILGHLDECRRAGLTTIRHDRHYPAR